MWDYKSYRGEVVVPLRRLTILLGKNNSGKTAAARLPLLLLSAAARHGGRRGEPVPLSVRGLDYGSSVLELVHGESAHSRFGIGCTVRPAPTAPEIALAVHVQLRQSLASRLTSFVADFEGPPLLPRVNWTPDLSSHDIRYTDPSVLAFDGVLPRYSDGALQDTVDEVRRASERALDELVHLTSLRRPLKLVYEDRSHEGEFDPAGADAAYLLNESEPLLARVSGWYERQLDTRIELARGGGAFRLIVGGRGTEHSLARAGQGIQQALPVVTHFTAMGLGHGTRYMVVEEPELNLHPAVHGDLGDLAIEACLSDPSVQVLVETHSENLVLRLRYRVARREFDPANVNLLWFQHNNGATTVREILIHEDGSVSEWPSGVFSEDLAEARAIAKVRDR